MSERPDLYWRGVVRQGMSRFRPTGPDPEAEFLAFVQPLYDQEKQRADQATAPHTPDLALYTLAAALLTYGRIDVIDDVLRNLPPPRHPARILARSVSDLLPLPAGLDPLVDPQPVAAWIDKVRPDLRWSAEQGRFLCDGG